MGTREGVSAFKLRKITGSRKGRERKRKNYSKEEVTREIEWIIENVGGKDTERGLKRKLETCIQ